MVGPNRIRPTHEIVECETVECETTLRFFGSNRIRPYDSLKAKCKPKLLIH